MTTSLIDFQDLKDECIFLPMYAPPGAIETERVSAAGIENPIASQPQEQLGSIFTGVGSTIAGGVGGAISAVGGTITGGVSNTFTGYCITGAGFSIMGTGYSTDTIGLGFVDALESAQMWVFDFEPAGAYNLMTLLDTGLPELETLEQKFRRLADRWREETDGFSIVGKKANHPDYRTIIDLGTPALPYILKELRDRGGHWFWALSAITGKNPIPKEDAGNVKKMREAWLRWGEEKRLI